MGMAQRVRSLYGNTEAVELTKYQHLHDRLSRGFFKNDQLGVRILRQ